ncbi:MAG: hypothetical protein ABJI96_17860 [Paracoccaceae bacterium]
MRRVFAVLALGFVAACTQPTVPDSGPGALRVNSPEQQRARDAALENPGLPSPYAISGEPSGTLVTPVVTTPPPPQAPAAATTASDGADIAAETKAALAATAANSGVAPIEASPSNPQPLLLNSPGISTENNFEAVSERRTIEGDAERLASNREQYEVIAPTDLPARSADARPNIVAFALATSNAPGTQVHNRSALNSQSKFRRNCAKYASSDLAQEDFLRRGGPDRDRKGLDPDGDGYACNWDPSPFRAAAGN